MGLLGSEDAFFIIGRFKCIEMLHEFAEAKKFTLVFADFFNAEHVSRFDDDLLILEALEFMGRALKHRPDFHFHYNLILYNCYPRKPSEGHHSTCDSIIDSPYHHHSPYLYCYQYF